LRTFSGSAPQSSIGRAYSRTVTGEFEQEALQLAQDRGFEITLAVGIPQAEEVEQVRIAEHEIRCERIGILKLLEIRPNCCFRQPRNGRAFEQHAADAIAKGADAPAFHPAHVGVELSRQLVFQVENFLEMAPAEVLRESRYLRLVRPDLDKPDHMKEVLPAEAGAIVGA
jgi:hypothetical protein